jgi:hypothetical protein
MDHLARVRVIVAVQHERRRIDRGGGTHLLQA